MLNKKAMRARIGAVAALLLALGALSACGGEGGAGATSQNTLRIGLSDQVMDLPVATAPTSATLITTLVHRGLTALDGDGEVIPALAAEWTQPSDTTYEFKLQDGAEFQDGTAITSEVAKKSLEYTTSSDSGSRAASVLGPLIKSIATPDDTTLVFKLAKPFAALPNYLAVPGMAIVPQDTLSPGASAWVGAGPFEVIKHDDSGITLEKSENYYGADYVSLESIDVKFYEDSTARANALIDGTVDFIDYVDSPDIERLQSSDGLSVATDEDPSLAGGAGLYLTFNVTAGPLADSRVRQAIALAINRDNIVAAALDGHGASRTSVLPTNSEFADPDLAETWDTDVVRAKNLLAEAGYAHGFDVDFLTTAQYSYHQDAAVSIQADLAKIGIKATLDNPDFAARMEKGAKGQFDIQINGNVGAVNDPSYLLDWVSGPPAGFKSYGFNDKELNVTLTKAMAARGQEQIDLYQKAQQLVVDSTPFTSLVTLTQAFAFNDSVTGFKILPNFTSKYSGYSLVDVKVSEG